MIATNLQDPVCGTYLRDERISVEYKGKLYGFCSQECCDRFAFAPSKYVTRSKITPKKTNPPKRWRDTAQQIVMEFGVRGR